MALRAVAGQTPPHATTPCGCSPCRPVHTAPGRGLSQAVASCCRRDGGVTKAAFFKLMLLRCASTPTVDKQPGHACSDRPLPLPCLHARAPMLMQHQCHHQAVRNRRGQWRSSRHACRCLPPPCRHGPPAGCYSCAVTSQPATCAIMGEPCCGNTWRLAGPQHATVQRYAWLNTHAQVFPLVGQQQ